MRTAALCVAFVWACAAQAPRIANARMEERAAAALLEREFRALVASASGPVWIGYAVPMVAGDRRMCCYSSDRCCGCNLEERKGAAQTVAAGPVRLEAGRNLLVLFRAEQQRVGKIRSFSDDCELDGGGLPFHWLTGVRPADSLALLASFAGEDKLGEQAIAAIAHHADPAADRLLEEFVAPGRPEKQRERTAFWLGAARGRPGYEILKRLVREDPSDRVRDKAVFALSVSKQPEAVDAMIDTARNDRSAHVRGQALFWLAQKAGKKAAQAITGAIETDPATEVKKRAVFALSQLPKSEGVPLLIQVARTNRNPEVRKQAVFWLGQSRDERALKFFEEILK